MRILISGSTGLLGSALAAALAARGDEIWTLDRRPQGTHALGWRDTPEQLAVDLPAGLDAVIHLAGAPLQAWPWTRRRRERIRSSRVTTTKLLARALALKANPACALLSGSAVGIYRPGWPILDEDGPKDPDTFIGALCRDWEAAASPACEAGLPVAWLRTGLVLDARGGMLGALLPVWRLGLGGRIGPANLPWSWIHVADWVGAVTFILDQRLEGPFNLCAPQVLRQDEALRILGRVLGRPGLLAVPAWLVALAGGQLGRELILRTQAAKPERLIREGFVHHFPELEKALRDLLPRR